MFSPFNQEDTLTKYLLINLFLLCLVGIIMVYSSSYLFAKENFGSASHFFIRQIVFCFMGIGIIWGVGRVRFLYWFENGWKMNLLFIMIMLITIIPGIGTSLKGAKRWILLGGFSFQPGEVVKYLVIFSSIYFFENFQHLDLKKRILQSSLMLIPLIILAIQPDFGTFFIASSVIKFVCYMSRFPRKYFYGLISSGIVLALSLIYAAPYRVQRILTYLDPWKDPQNSGFQIIQSYLAFANGFIWGQGIGNSNEKLFYLPEAHNDFILSVIGEEFGLLGVLVIILLFLSLLYWGFQLALKSANRLSMIFMAAITFAIGIQAFLNMSVVLGLLPTKGLNLPFISYGGSSMISNCFAIGLLISASRMGRHKDIKDIENG
jgi:cell division protein FtsW